MMTRPALNAQVHMYVTNTRWSLLPSSIRCTCSSFQSISVSTLLDIITANTPVNRPVNNVMRNFAKVFPVYLQVSCQHACSANRNIAVLYP
jgi:hypothetical protein